MLGEVGAGKSWVANQISNNFPLQYGQVNEPNTDVLYYLSTSSNFNEDAGWYSILDTKGQNMPPLADDLSDLYKFQVLQNESNLIDALRLEYMIKNCGIIIQVVGRITTTDIITTHRISRRSKQIRSATRPLQVIIVHNLSWIKRIDDVKKEISFNLNPSLSLRKAPPFNTNQKVYFQKSCNHTRWKDAFNFTHLVIAADNSEAGDYYNKGTIKFLRSQIKALEKKISFNYPAEFVGLCSTAMKIRNGRATDSTDFFSAHGIYNTLA